MEQCATSPISGMNRQYYHNPMMMEGSGRGLVVRAVSRIPWPVGQIWPADLIQLARVGMLSALIVLLMSTKSRVSFIDVTKYEILCSKQQVNFQL